MHGLTVTVEDIQLGCLFRGRNATLTCHFSGLPRPGILFKRAGVNIIPGTEGFERITALSLNEVRAGNFAMKPFIGTTTGPQNQSCDIKVLDALQGHATCCSVSDDDAGGQVHGYRQTLHVCVNTQMK